MFHRPSKKFGTLVTQSNGWGHGGGDHKNTRLSLSWLVGFFRIAQTHQDSIQLLFRQVGVVDHTIHQQWQLVGRTLFLLLDLLLFGEVDLELLQLLGSQRLLVEHVEVKHGRLFLFFWLLGHHPFRDRHVKGRDLFCGRKHEK